MWIEWSETELINSQHIKSFEIHESYVAAYVNSNEVCDYFEKYFETRKEAEEFYEEIKEVLMETPKVELDLSTKYSDSSRTDCGSDMPNRRPNFRYHRDF